jgi:hypothetical protein
MMPAGLAVYDRRQVITIMVALVIDKILSPKEIFKVLAGIIAHAGHSIPPVVKAA